MSQFKVLVTHPQMPEATLQLLRQTCTVTICEGLPTPSRQEILAKCAGMDGILWATTDRLDDEVLDAAGPQLRAIGMRPAGYDFCDVPAVKRRGIALANTAGVHNAVLADIAVGLLIAAARRFHEGRRCIETDAWNRFSPRWLQGRDIRGSTVGIVGLGGIGQAIVRRLIGFEVATFLYSGRGPKKEGILLGAEYVTLDELLRTSDFVVVACPLTEETTNLIDAEALGKMKTTAVLVNVARGRIVDQQALIEALRSGGIFAAGLDAMTPEPLPSDHELLQLPNCVLTPHIGSSTVAARENMALTAAKNMLAGLNGKPMDNAL